MFISLSLFCAQRIVTPFSIFAPDFAPAYSIIFTQQSTPSINFIHIPSEITYTLRVTIRFSVLLVTFFNLSLEYQDFVDCYTLPRAKFLDLFYLVIERLQWKKKSRHLAQMIDLRYNLAPVTI